MLEADRTVPLLARRQDSSGPLNTAGSLITGGRYYAPESLPGAHEMLSLAENTAVAHAEARAITVVAGPPGIVIGPGPDQRPRLDITVKLRLGAVLDLTDASVEAHLELRPGELLQPWLALNVGWQLALTQILARAVLDSARYDAIRSPSGQDRGGRDSAVFLDRVAPGDRAVYDPEDELRVFRTPRGTPGR